MFWFFLIGFALLYLVYLVAMYKMQSRIVFTGSYMGPRVLRRQCLPAGEWLELGEHKVHALYLESEDQVGVPALMIAHGNAQILEDWGHSLKFLHEELNMRILIIEYPRFMESTGNDQPEPTQESVAEGFVAGYDWLKEKGVESIHAMGLSIGTGVVCDLVTRREIESLCLMAPFHSIERFSRRYLVPPFILKSPYRNTEALKSFSGSVLIMRALQDQLFLKEHTTALLKAASDARLIEVDCGHSAVPDYLPDYRNDLQKLWS